MDYPNLNGVYPNLSSLDLDYEQWECEGMKWVKKSVSMDWLKQESAEALH